MVPGTGDDLTAAMALSTGRGLQDFAAASHAGAEEARQAETPYCERRPAMRKRPPHAADAFYHVTLRGNRQQAIFHDEGDRHRWESLLSEGLDRHGSRIHLYCWMTNHLHMLLQCGIEPVHKTIHFAAGGYARCFNAKYNHVGHLFQGRYGSTLVDNNAYLLQLIRYIHLNPVEAGIVDTPSAYRWSSCRAYTNAHPEPWLTTEFLLGLFDGDRSCARMRMTAYTCSAEGIARSAESITFDASGRLRQLRRLIDAAAERFATDRSELAGPSRSDSAGKARAWVAWEAKRCGIASVATVARSFNRRASILNKSIRRYRAEFDGFSSTP
jgi:REP element-mobilizing transposase RayT